MVGVDRGRERASEKLSFMMASKLLEVDLSGVF